MIPLIDLDSLLYYSVYRIVSIQQMKELLSINYDSIPYSDRKRLAFDYIIDTAIDRMGNKLLKVYDAIENTGIKLDIPELYITHCKDSIRKNISVDYKAKRKRNKWVSEIRQRLINEGNVIWDNQYEADDLIADRAKELNEQGKEYIIVSIDKDLKQIPGWHFSYYPMEVFDSDGNKYSQMKGLSHVTPYDSWKMLAYQVIAGDHGDGIKGIPGLGEAKTLPLIQHCKTYHDFLRAVTKAYVCYEWNIKEKMEKKGKQSDYVWRDELFKNFRLVYLGRT